MTWHTGEPWRVVEALQRLNAQIRAACPRAIPPATPASSWGSIADSAHSTSSDHYPHYYTALGSTAVVCARDWPHAPSLGLDIHAIIEQIRLSRDPRVGYLISNRRITGPAHNWQWDPYSGSDPHDTHGHVSSVHTKLADSTADWQIGALDMATLDEINNKVQFLYDALRFGGVDAGAKVPGTTTNAGLAKTDFVVAKAAAVPLDLATIKSKLDALAATPPGTVTITDEQLERVLRKVIGSVDGASPQS